MKQVKSSKVECALYLRKKLNVSRGSGSLCECVLCVTVEFVQFQVPVSLRVCVILFPRQMSEYTVDTINRFAIAGFNLTNDTNHNTPINKESEIAIDGRAKEDERVEIRFHA